MDIIIKRQLYFWKQLKKYLFFSIQMYFWTNRKQVFTQHKYEIHLTKMEKKLFFYLSGYFNFPKAKFGWDNDQSMSTLFVEYFDLKRGIKDWDKEYHFVLTLKTNLIKIKVLFDFFFEFQVSTYKMIKKLLPKRQYV